MTAIIKRINRDGEMIYCGAATTRHRDELYNLTQQTIVKLREQGLQNFYIDTFDSNGNPDDNPAGIPHRS